MSFVSRDRRRAPLARGHVVESFSVLMLLAIVAAPRVASATTFAVLFTTTGTGVQWDQTYAANPAGSTRR